MEGINGFRELEPSNQLADLLSYIQRELPMFVESREFVDILIELKNENQHSLAFCVFMTNRCQSKFCFQRENAQMGSSVIDIGVYQGSILIFVMEAKALPTPKGTGKRPRDIHEYVYGHGGGIQRFKDGKHGVDNGRNPFQVCGMIAYIKLHDFGHWLTQINQWILQANWSVEEFLHQTSTEGIGRLHSTHHRLDGSELQLHHFWVQVPSK